MLRFQGPALRVFNDGVHPQAKFKADGSLSGDPEALGWLKDAVDEGRVKGVTYEVLGEELESEEIEGEEIESEEPEIEEPKKKGKGGK